MRRDVLRQHRGGEAPDAALARGVGERMAEPAPEALALQVVGDDDRHLGRVPGRSRGRAPSAPTPTITSGPLGASTATTATWSTKSTSVRYRSSLPREARLGHEEALRAADSCDSRLTARDSALLVVGPDRARMTTPVADQ